MKPTFEFLSNSDGADPSGVATWTYIAQVRGEDVETTIRQRFGSFVEANGINELIRHAFESGIRVGDERVCRAVDLAVREYR